MRFELSAKISPTISPFMIFLLKIFMLAFIFFRTSKSPVLKKLSPTFLSIILLCLVIRAATIKKAAELKSPGTKISFGFKKFGDFKVITFSFFFILAPRYLRRISVWSRLGIFSLSIVVPFKFKLARRIALLTWAEPISREYFIGMEESLLLSSFIGRQPLLCLINTFILSSGSTILIIGLDERDSSPVKFTLTFLVDSKPMRSLKPVPELPRNNFS